NTIPFRPLEATEPLPRRLSTRNNSEKRTPSRRAPPIGGKVQTDRLATGERLLYERPVGEKQRGIPRLLQMNREQSTVPSSAAYAPLECCLRRQNKRRRYPL